MIRFALRRLSVAGLQVLLVTFVAYVLFYVITSLTGASPAQRVAGHAADPAQVSRVAHLLGTDLPWYLQYVHFLGGVVRGDFGYSFQQRLPVAQIIFPAAGVTASLVIGAALLWILIAVVVGLIGASWPRSIADRGLAVIVQIGISAPVFWVAPMLSFALAYQPSQGTIFGIPIGTSIAWLPIEGYVDFNQSPFEWARHLLLPCLALALGFAAFYARFVRALVLEQLGEDYVRVAKAKGATYLHILASHVGRVVAPSIVTLVGLDVGATLGGALFVEQTFGLPGLGHIAVSSIQNLDFPLTIGAITFAALMAVAANTAADIFQAALDPRVRG
jgi:peptide/nickel transport system permease protein